MKTRIFTVAILVPALMVLTTTPANAIFGSILAGIQRAQMIINQGVQIYEAQIAKLTMDGQLSELTINSATCRIKRSAAWGRLHNHFKSWQAVRLP